MVVASRSFAAVSSYLLWDVRTMITKATVYSEGNNRFSPSKMSRFQDYLIDLPLSPVTDFVRVGAVSYLNSKPLIEGLARVLGKFGNLSTDLPSKLADQLHSGQIDIGLIPVVEYFRNPAFRRVSTSAIVSRGPVWSVRLFFRGSPDSVKRVAMDEGSRTSVALSKVLLHDRLGKIPETTTLPMNGDPSEIDADAVLLIGDRAMHPEKFADTFAENWDLGEKWWQVTGLPFVFATWVARNSSFDEIRLGDMFDLARENGKAAIPRIAAESASLYQLSEEACREYLTQYIHFELDRSALKGLEEFRDRCHHLSLIP
jgi:chorismate dehydratase